MAVYTNITESELSAFLATYDLGVLRSFAGIAQGVENSNFRVETERGRYILTLYERRVRTDDLPFFLGLMRHLAASGFPSPMPQRDRAGQMLSVLNGKPAAIVSFLAGASDVTPGVEKCRAAGEGLAALHATAADFSIRRGNSLGKANWRPLFDAHRAACRDFAPDLEDLMAKDLDALDAAWPSDLPEGVIHADLFPDNVFFEGDRFAAAIDFYFACNDMLAYDLAVCLNAWCHSPDGALRVELARAMVEGYERRRPLSPEERKALPILARGAAMRFFLTRLADWGATPEGALVKPHNPMDYAARLAFHRRAADDLRQYGLDA